MRTAKLKAVLLAVALVLPTAACGTSRADTVPSDHTASANLSSTLLEKCLEIFICVDERMFTAKHLPFLKSG